MSSSPRVSANFSHSGPVGSKSRSRSSPCSVAHAKQNPIIKSPIQILKRPSGLPPKSAPPCEVEFSKKLAPSISKAKDSTAQPRKKPAEFAGEKLLAVSSSPSSTASSIKAPSASSTKQQQPRRSRPKPRRNSISTSSRSLLNPLPSQGTGRHSSHDCSKGGHLSDGSIHESSRPKTNNYLNLPNSVPSARVASCPSSKEEAAELLLQTLLQGDTSDLDGPPPSYYHHLPNMKISPPSAVDFSDLNMASHLLLSLLKPSVPISSSLSSPKPTQYYAGPMFRKAPAPSALPLPPFLSD